MYFIWNNKDVLRQFRAYLKQMKWGIHMSESLSVVTEELGTIAFRTIEFRNFEDDIRYGDQLQEWLDQRRMIQTGTYVLGFASAGYHPDIRALLTEKWKSYIVKYG